MSFLQFLDLDSMPSFFTLMNWDTPNQRKSLGQFLGYQRLHQGFYVESMGYTLIIYTVQCTYIAYFNMYIYISIMYNKYVLHICVYLLILESLLRSWVGQSLPWKFMSCSQCQELDQLASDWLFTQLGQPIRSPLICWPNSWQWLQLINFHPCWPNCWQWLQLINFPALSMVVASSGRLQYTSISLSASV